jgi:hypothetical protein
MTGKAKFTACKCFNQRRKLGAVGIMTLQALPFCNRFMKRGLKFHFMAHGAHFLTGVGQPENVAVFNGLMTHAAMF